MHRTVPVLILVATLLAGAGPAAARTERSVRYGFDEVFPAAVRFLRIDEGCRILEKDGDAGYVMFELRDEGKTFRGALEVVRARDGRGRPTLKLLLRIEDRPAYMEAGILDRFLQRLRADLGEPPAPPEPPAEPAPPAEATGPAEPAPR